MPRHFAVWTVVAIVALSCYGQDKKVPFLQIEQESSLSLQPGWSDSSNGANLMAAGTSPNGLFEPGFRRSITVNTQSPRHDRVLDAKFFIVNGSSTAMTFLDYATSRHCVALHECIEANPLMPKSLGGMIFVGALSDTTISIYSYFLKRRHFRTTWAIGPTANAGLHLWGMHAGLKSW